MGTNFDVLQRSQAVIYGDCGAIWVMTLFAKPAVDDMTAARSALRMMHQRHPQGFPALTWVLEEAGFSMDADARQTAATVTREFNASIRAMATLIEGEGVRAAAVRAIVSGIDLVSRASARKQVFGKLDECVAWCASMRPERERDAGAPGPIAASLAAMRTELPARATERSLA
jgi:hypothetical protein